MDAYLTIAGAEYIVGYDYKITSPGAPEQRPSYDSGGQPAEPFEFDVEFVDLRKDDGGGKGLRVDAIKLYRKMTGATLKAALDFINGFQSRSA